MRRVEQRSEVSSIRSPAAVSTPSVLVDGGESSIPHAVTLCAVRDVRIDTRIETGWMDGQRLTGWLNIR